MNIAGMSIDEMRFCTEFQIFDRKSAKIDAKDIAVPMIAFANADGGVLAVGIENDGKVTGIDGHKDNVNEILRAPLDFCQPSIMIQKEEIECVDCKGNKNHILLIKVPASNELHANQKDEAFLRVGDKSKKLTFEERMQLLYSKGARYYEDEPVYGTSVDDIDMNAVREFCKKIGYAKDPEEYIRQNKEFLVTKNGREELSGAAVLLFAKNPQRFFKRARVRFIRYEGTEAKVGAQMNVVKDKIFEGRIIDMLNEIMEYMKTQIKEYTYLGADAKFVTDPEYPEFVWQEVIVNAVCHRDYSIKGTDIQIKMFDDHITVESPGTLPGTVRLYNMRTVHFSRNPKIAEVLQKYKYVKEFGEGVDRMYREMKEAGLPEPEYAAESFMVYATIKNKQSIQADAQVGDQVDTQVSTQVAEGEDLHRLILEFCSIPRSKAEITAHFGYKNKKGFARNHLNILIEEGRLQMTIPDKPTSSKQKYVTVKSK